MRREFWRTLWAIVAVIFIALPHLPYMPPWVGVLLFGSAGWRLGAAEYGWRLPGPKLRVPLVALSLAAVAWTYHRISGIEAGSALLLVMLALKLLETRSARDRSLIGIICFVLMFAAFLREQAIWSIGYLAAGTTLCLVALLQADDHSQSLPAGATLRTAGRLLMHAVPLMAVLFVLFPRVPGPFWALPTHQGAAKTGLAESVSPGDITALGRSDAVAFRVRFKDAVPAPEERYWRGPVMSYFNGETWSWRSRGTGPQRDSLAPPTGRAYEYEITLEPHNRRWLLALESPISWDHKDANYSPDWQLINKEPVADKLSYRATSVTGGLLVVPENDRYLQAMRHLPAGSNPRARTLARQLRGEHSDDRAYLAAILSLFRNQAFFYTLTPPRLDGDPVDSFLFDSRAGFCEHYASAFAVLARAGGIPARLVTGYLGAQANPLGDYWIVRQSDAHAWVEVWIDNRWQRYDPTAAVAPERVELGMDNAIPNLGRSPLTLVRGNALLSQVLFSIDAINAAWDKWVLGFGPDAQMALLARLGISRPEVRHLMIGAIAGCAVCLVLLAWALARPARRTTDPLLLLYRQFGRRLAAVFRPAGPTEGPADYARAASAAHPGLGPQIDAITALYLRLRYEHQPDGLAELRSRIRKFRAK